MSDNRDQESNQNSDQASVTTEAAPAMGSLTELEMLKQRAKMMNITFSNNIGVDALKQKIEDRLNGAPEQLDDEQEASIETIELNALEMGMQVNLENAQQAEVEKRPETLRERLIRENMPLLRCRITNLDPKKKDLPGEVVTFANEYLGTVRVFVPFGEPTEDGWHIPKCIYNLLNERKFLNIRTIRDPKTRTEKVSTVWAKEFALEILEPLTVDELRQLAQAQIAAGSVDTMQLA